MELAFENRVKRAINYLAVMMVFFTMVLIPAALIYIEYVYMANHLQLKSNIIAEDASVHFYQYPESWMFHEEILQAIIQQHIMLDVEKSRLVSLPYELEMTAGILHEGPVLERVAPISDGENQVATVSVQTSLQPLVNTALVYFLLSLLLGLCVLTGLYIWPYKSLKHNLRQLKKTRSALEDEMSLKKEIMTELEKERDFTNTVIDSAGNAIVVLDTSGYIVRFNRTAEKLTGYSSEDVYGRAFWDIVLPEKIRERSKQNIEQLMSGNIESTSNYECEWQARNGDLVPLSCNSSLLKDRLGNPAYIVIMGVDISDRLEADRHKERLQRELNQARKMEALGQLTGGIAHDFNNMLGIISGYSDLAQEKANELQEPELEKYVENIMQASQRASDLVRQMMVFSRNDPGEDRLLNISDVVAASMNMLRSVIPSSILMDYQSDEGIPKVMLDEVQLQQVIMNLCLNAKDAMHGIGEIKVRLLCNTMQGEECHICHKSIMGDWVELSVSDTGEGMSQDVIEHIFEPFFTTKQVGQGTGMGLSMVHTIVDSHGGHLFIDSVVNQGTTFRILFPVADASTAGSNLASQEEQQDTEIAGAGEKIMVVDDEPSLAHFIGDMLDNHGYVSRVETDSHAALEAFKKAPDAYDMLITDQTMPGLTGVELISEMRALNPSLKVILASGYSEMVDRTRAESMGVCYISKPFTAYDLLSSVRQELVVDRLAD